MQPRNSIIACAVVILSFLCGCASHRPKRELPTYAPPSTDRVQASVGRAISKTVETGTKITAAKTSANTVLKDLEIARVKIEEIIKAAPVELQAQVSSLKLQLDVTQRGLIDTTMRLDEATLAATDARTQLDQTSKDTESLHAEIAKQTQTLNQVRAEWSNAIERGDELQGQLSKTVDERNHQTRLAWKWRLITIGGGLLAMLVLFRKPLGAMFGLPIP